MRNLRTKVILVLLLMNSLALAGQTHSFTRDDIEYVFELPSPAWQVVARVDVHNHPEFINGTDPLNGYLRLRKILVEQPAGTAELFARDEKWELRHLPGYVVCSACDGEAVAGRLRGEVFSYEFVRGGNAMFGRIYYLQLNQRTFYSLHFTGAREKLQSMREQMDHMAHSFHLK
jgi:hypothetical protein